MNFKDYFSGEEMKRAEKIIIRFHDRLFLDKKIDNTKALLISTYMISNKEKRSQVKKTDVENIFIKLGRKKDAFSKALYERSGKRKNKKGKKEAWINKEGDLIGLNFNGIKKVKEILQGEKDG